MTNADSSRLTIAPTAAGYLLGVSGRGTIRESRVLYELATRLLEDERCRLVLDLSECSYLDSTFLGCLARLDRQFRQTGTPRFVVAGSRDHCKTLFGSTKLQQLITLVEQPPQVTGGVEPIACGELERRDLGRHVMESHRELAGIEGPEQAVFAKIANEIARELGEQPAARDRTPRARNRR